MWIPILAIALAFINVWLLSVAASAANCTTRRTAKAFAVPHKGISLWSLILLLLTGSPAPASSLFSRPHHSDSVLSCD